MTNWKARAAGITVKDSWLISLEFHRDAFRNGMDPLSFIRYLKTLGEIKEIITAVPIHAERRGNGSGKLLSEF